MDSIPTPPFDEEEQPMKFLVPIPPRQTNRHWAPRWWMFAQRRNTAQATYREHSCSRLMNSRPQPLKTAWERPGWAGMKPST